MRYFWQKIAWATLWAIFSQTHLVTLMGDRFMFSFLLFLRETRAGSCSMIERILEIVHFLYFWSKAFIFIFLHTNIAY
jgi:hypothetical protein